MGREEQRVAEEFNPPTQVRRWTEVVASAGPLHTAEWLDNTLVRR